MTLSASNLEEATSETQVTLRNPPSKASLLKAKNQNPTKYFILLNVGLSPHHNTTLDSWHPSN